MTENAMKDRNKNPWYILMTLYGEQEGDEIDWDLAEKNRKLWNAWICQGMDEERRYALVDKTRINRSETDWSAEKGHEVERRYVARWHEVHGTESSPPQRPDPSQTIDLKEIFFSNILVLERTIFSSISFSEAYFCENIYFRDAYFCGPTNFSTAHFRKVTDFGRAHFFSRISFWYTQFGKGTDFGEAHFCGNIDFFGAYFNELAYFGEAHFDERTGFRSVHFSDTTDFRLANFCKNTDFESAVFGNVADFRGANFSDVTNFDKVHFGKQTHFMEARFVEHSQFRSAHFGEMTDFRGVSFGEMTDFCSSNFGDVTSFVDVHFGQRVEFVDAHFGNTTNFDRAHFGEETNFSNTHFGTTIDFTGAQFQRFCYFNGAVFGTERSNGQCRPNFSNATFARPTSFEKAKFSSDLPVLTGATLPEALTVTAKSAHWPVMPRGFWARVWRHLVSGARSNATRQHPAEIRESASKLRHAMARQMLPEEEHFFFRREMWAVGRTTDWFSALPIKTYGFISEYGHSIGRPVILLFALWLAGWFLYAQHTAMGIGKSAAYSFATMFKFFGLQGTYMDDETDKLTEWMQVISGGQTVLAFILLFFLGLGLRTRFRLR